ncbi:hypothetical protein V8D89_015701 [Ganoderma adspersum]
MEIQETRRLPIELFELVIDCLHDEKTLHSTSLVCKAWLPRSRFNLFRSIELNLPRHLDGLIDLLASTPEIAPIIQELSVSENSILALFRPTMSIAARFPLSLSSHPLIQLRRLTVHHQLWLPTRYSPDYLLELSQLTSITCLDLFDVSFTTVADFSIVLRALAHLESISLAHLDCQRQLDPETSAAIGYELPLLRTLRVVADHPTSPIDWFLSCNKFPSLQDVDISYELSVSDPHQALGALWASAGSTLESVTLSISKRSTGSHFPLEVIEKQLDMSNCIALRTLRFDCRNEREVSPDWTWLVWLLKHSPPASTRVHALGSIVLAFQNSSHALASLHSFAGELDGAISGAPWMETLTEVVFECDYGLPSDEDPDELALVKRFPELHLSDRLRVR